MFSKVSNGATIIITHTGKYTPVVELLKSYRYEKRFYHYQCMMVCCTDRIIDKLRSFFNDPIERGCCR